MRNTTGYRRIASLFFGQPLALLPAKLIEIREFLLTKFQGRDVDPAHVRAVTAQRRAGNGVQMAGNRVAIVPVMGALAQRGGGIDEASEQLVSCEEIGATLETLVADRTVRSIVMLFDSPGGSVYGVAELANKINALKADKKICGMVDSTCASAAYWVASQCTDLTCCPGGAVGSIGVLAVHENHAARLEKEGIETTLVTSSKFKGEGSPFSALDADARAEIQAKCDAYHGMFASAVARGRGVTEAVVNRTYGQGRMLLAKDAKDAGMIDSVATFAQLLNRMGAGGGGGMNATASRVPLSARLAAVRARAVEVECETEAAETRHPLEPRTARTPASPEEVRARLRQLEKEIGGN